jgi:hypothetical protein
MVLSGEREKSSTGNILNLVRRTDALVDMHGENTWTLHIVASTADIAIYMQKSKGTFPNN